MKRKLNYSLVTLKNLSTEFLYEIVNSDDYDIETRLNAQRVINSRQA